MPVRGERDDWPDFTSSARLQFWALPAEIIEAFASVFPEFTRTPLRPSATLDVGPIRNDATRWRLKVAGYRPLYQVRQGSPIIERIVPRTSQTYKEFERVSRRGGR